jgi:hypothetical protein
MDRKRKGSLMMTIEFNETLKAITKWQEQLQPLRNYNSQVEKIIQATSYLNTSVDFSGVIKSLAKISEQQQQVARLISNSLPDLETYSRSISKVLTNAAITQATISSSLSVPITNYLNILNSVDAIAKKYVVDEPAFRDLIDIDEEIKEEIKSEVVNVQTENKTLDINFRLQLLNNILALILTLFTLIQTMTNDHDEDIKADLHEIKQELNIILEHLPIDKSKMHNETEEDTELENLDLSGGEKS